MKMKRSILLLLAVMLFICAGCVKTNYQKGDWIFHAENGEACIIDYLDRPNEIDIPKTLEGSTVTKLGKELFGNGEITATSITIPDTVKVIGDKAFMNCTGLVTITIPKSVEYIGESAFENCTSLKTIKFKGDIENIGAHAFDGTPWYKDKHDGVVYIGTYAYAVKGSPETIELKSSTTAVQLWGFDKTACSIIVIPKSVKTIGANAFKGSSLQTLKIENGSARLVIGESAFEGCTKLESVTLPKRVNEIKDKAFSGTGISSVSFSEGLNKIGNYAFEKNNSIEEITLPSGIAEIGVGAFSNCDALLQISISGNMEEIPEKMLYGCETLERIDIAEGIKVINKRAFSCCPNLLNITLPSSLERMSSNAFWGEKTWDEPKTIHITGYVDSYASVYAHNHGLVFKDIKEVAK